MCTNKFPDLISLFVFSQWVVWIANNWSKPSNSLNPSIEYWCDGVWTFQGLCRTWDRRLCAWAAFLAGNHKFPKILSFPVHESRPNTKCHLFVEQFTGKAHSLAAKALIKFIQLCIQATACGFQISEISRFYLFNSLRFVFPLIRMDHTFTVRNSK